MLFRIKPVCKTLLVVLLTATAGSVSAVDLVGVYNVAVDQDAELRAAVLRLQATEKNSSIAWANFFPQINAQLNYTLGDSNFTSDEFNAPGFDVIPAVDTTVDIDRFTANFNLRQNIFSWQNYGLLSQAKAQVSVAQADYDTAYQTFLLRVAERYFAVLTAQDSLIFAEAEQKALQRQFDQAEQRFEVGLTAVTDVLDARASYDQARARVIVAQNTLDDAYEGLRALTGTSFEMLAALEQELPLESPEPADADEWVDIAISNSPTLQASRESADVAEANIGIQRSGYLPTLDFVASYNRFQNNAFNFRSPNQQIIGTSTSVNRDTQFGLELNIPIFNGLRSYRQTEQARINLNAAFEDVEFNERTVVRSTINFYRSVLADIEEVQAREQAVISARGALDATQAGFEVGTRTIVDVLLSEQRFFQAQRDYSTARHNYILDQLRLKQAAGVLEAEDLVRVNTLLHRDASKDEQVEDLAEEATDTDTAG